MRRTLWLIALLCAAPRVAAAQDYAKPGPHTVAEFTAEWTDTRRDREIPVRIYHPKDAEGKLAIVIFSHGLGGSRDGYRYLGTHWAGHGYVSVHLQHKGSDTAVWKGVKDPIVRPKSRLGRDALGI